MLNWFGWLLVSCLFLLGSACSPVAKSVSIPPSNPAHPDAAETAFHPPSNPFAKDPPLPAEAPSSETSSPTHHPLPTPPTPPEGSPGTGEAESAYTCPMHSKVVTQEPGKCPICGMALVVKKKRAPHAP